MSEEKEEPNPAPNQPYPDERKIPNAWLVIIKFYFVSLVFLFISYFMLTGQTV